MTKKNITISILLAILIIVIGIGIGISITKIDSEPAAVGMLERNGLVLRSSLELNNVSLDKSGLVSKLQSKKGLDLSTDKLDKLNLSDKLLATDGLNDLYNLPDLNSKEVLLGSLDLQKTLQEGLTA